jgi:protein transport protein SEC23
VALKQKTKQQMDVHDIEDRDGVRWSWNVWPNSKTEAAKIVVPIGLCFFVTVVH